MPGLLTTTERHLLGGVILSLITFVFLLLCTFSVPFIKPIFFLQFPFSNGRITMGAYGWCYDEPSTKGSEECYGPALGYEWDPQLIRWLVKALITIGIACAFSLIALITLLLDIFFRSSYQLTNPVWFRLSAGLAALTSILAFVFTTVLFHNGRIRFENTNVDASYGPAEWLLLTAAITSTLSLCVGGPRFTGRHMYRADNQAAYNV